MMENNYFFIKKVHIKTDRQCKKKDVLVINPCIARNKEF